jgi:hypothetical protein
MFEFKWADYQITVIEDSADDFRFSAIDVDGIDRTSELSDRENFEVFTKYVSLVRESDNRV